MPEFTVRVLKKEWNIDGYLKITATCEDDAHKILKEWFDTKAKLRCSTYIPIEEYGKCLKLKD